MNSSTILCQALVSPGSNISQDMRVSWVFLPELPELPLVDEVVPLDPHAASSGAASPAAAAKALPCNSFRRLTAESNELADFFGLSILIPLLSEVRSYVVRNTSGGLRLVLSRLERRSNYSFF